MDIHAGFPPGFAVGLPYGFIWIAYKFRWIFRREIQVIIQVDFMWNYIDFRWISRKIQMDLWEIHVKIKRNPDALHEKSNWITTWISSLDIHLNPYGIQINLNGNPY